MYGEQLYTQNAEERKLERPGTLELAACDVTGDSKATGGRLTPSVSGYKETGRSVQNVLQLKQRHTEKEKLEKHRRRSHSPREQFLQNTLFAQTRGLARKPGACPYLNFQKASAI